VDLDAAIQDERAVKKRLISTQSETVCAHNFLDAAHDDHFNDVI